MEAGLDRAVTGDVMGEELMLLVAPSIGETGPDWGAEAGPWGMMMEDEAKESSEEASD